MVVVAGVRIYLEGLAAAVDGDADLQLVRACADVPADLCALAPDLLLLDVSLPGGPELAVRLLAHDAPPRIVAIAIEEDDARLVRYAEAGVSGFITADQCLDQALAVIHAVARGETLCSPRVAAILLRHVATLAAAGRTPMPGTDARLTPRELEVLHLIERGMSNKEIAGALHIEVATVKNHVHKVLDKLNVERRGEAAAHARRSDLSQV